MPKVIQIVSFASDQNFTIEPKPGFKCVKHYVVILMGKLFVLLFKEEIYGYFEE